MRKFNHAVLAVSALGLMTAACSGGQEAGETDEAAEEGEEAAEVETYENGIAVYPNVDAADVELGSDEDERTAEFTIEGSPFRAIDHYGPTFTGFGWENGAGTFDSANEDASQWVTLNGATGSDGSVRVTVGARGIEPAEGDAFENGLPAYPNVVEGSLETSSGSGDMVNVTFDTTDSVLNVMNFYSEAFEATGIPNRMMVYTAGDQGDGPGARITVNRRNVVRVTYHGAE